MGPNDWRLCSYFMLLPRDIPNPEQIAALEQRYGCIDSGACETCILLLHTVNDVVSSFCTHLASHDMSQGRFIVLMMMNREPDKLFMPSQLAELCSVTKATMTGLVDGLEREYRHVLGQLERAGWRRPAAGGLSAPGVDTPRGPQ